MKWGSIESVQNQSSKAVMRLLSTGVKTDPCRYRILPHLLERKTMSRLIMNPLSPTGVKQPIQSVLRALASQENCDGDPYDQMIEAAGYIDQLEQTVGRCIEMLENFRVLIMGE
jgi:hypothetical protein